MSKLEKIILGVLAALIIGGIGFIAVRDFKNQDLCKQKYGSTAKWEGQNTCSKEAGEL